MNHARLTLILFCTLSYVGIAQNDSINQAKYWKFRNRFVEKFIKIGPEKGESLPAGARVPKSCIDNVASDGTDPELYKTSDYGEMHWGDGMIRHGHYLALLATEYALLKKDGQDLTGILNELYYAIYAINRLDLAAEADLAPEYGVAFVGTVNGFYLREDVPEDFGLHWKDDPMRIGCTNSAYYENNNVAKIDNADKGFYVKERTSYQNVPSMDQMSSLMVALALVHKLVDDEFVKPKESDQGFKLITETKAIVQRMVMYAANRNWELIDINGWPVANGGGDLAFAAYPYVLSASRITGNPVDSYPDHFFRKRLKYHPKYYELQHCITGFGTSGSLPEQQERCDYLKLNMLHPGLKAMYKKLILGAQPGLKNNQNRSVYLNWNLSGYHHSIDMTKRLWNNNMANYLTRSSQDMKDEPEGAGLRSMEGVSSFNQAIVFNIGVSAGKWNSNVAHFFGNKTENRHLELMNAVLYDLEPAASKSFYQSYLNGMSSIGPFNVVGRNWTPNPEGPWYEEIYCAENGWGADYRWTEPDESYGSEGKQGVFSGLDYMILHNLYYLAFEKNDLPKFEQSFNCFCEDKIQVAISDSITDEEKIEALEDLNSRLHYVPTCQANVFKSLRNVVSDEFDVKPQFDDYPSLGIATAKYLTEDTYVEGSGRLTIKSHLIFFKDRMLFLEMGSQTKLVSGDMVLNENCMIDVSGEIKIGKGTNLRIKSGAKLILKEGARLIIQDGGKLIVEEGAQFEIYSGSALITEGVDVDLILKGTIKMMDGGMFNVIRRTR